MFAYENPVTMIVITKNNNIKNTRYAHPKKLENLYHLLSVYLFGNNELDDFICEDVVDLKKVLMGKCSFVLFLHQIQHNNRLSM